MIEWEPSPEAASSSSWEEVLNNWDPMREDSESIRNSVQTPTESLNSAEISCPFQTQPYTLCFKGRHCPYLHGKYTLDMQTEHPKLHDRQQSSILLAKHLPDQNLQLAKGLVTQAWVTTVISPSQFWVVLKNGTSCLCKGQQEHMEGPGHHRMDSSLEQLDILWNNMQHHYALVKERPSQYFVGELVAVRVEIGSRSGSGRPGGRQRKGWVRALVLEDTESDLGADQAAAVSLKLFDYGVNIVISVLECVPLHEKFGNDAPMAIHCSLFGASPRLDKWGVEEIEYFKKMVSGQLVLFQVQQSEISGEVHTHNHNSDMLAQPPLSVSLIVKSNGKFVRVGETIGELGLGAKT